MNAKAHPYILMLIAFSIPIFQNWLGLMIGVLLLNWIVGLVRKEFAVIVSHRHVYFLVAFYVIHGITLIWTSNMEDGLFDMQVKLSFLVLPLVVGTNGLLKAKDLKNIALAFIAGVSIAACYDLISSYLEFQETQNDWVYYGKYYSRLMHLGYFALCINLAIAIIFAWMMRNRKYLNWKRITLWMLLVVFLMGNLVITGSKNGILTLCILVIATALYVMIKFRLWLYGMLFLVLIGVAFSGFMLSSQRTQVRFQALIQSVTGEEGKAREGDKSTDTRMVAWNSSVTLIKENPLLGVGTGDVNDELIDLYEKGGYDRAKKIGINSHNQFLQTHVGTGIFGLAVLIIILLHPIRIAWRRKSYILTSFGLMILAFAMTESIFEVQSGVIIFSFFVSIYLFGIPRRYAKGDSFLLIR